MTRLIAAYGCIAALALADASVARAQPADACSCSTPGSCGEDDVALHPYRGDPVDLASGESVAGFSMVSVPTVGADVVAAIAYRSRSAVQGVASPGMPPGWTQSYSRRLLLDAERITLVNDEGAELPFAAVPGESGRYVPMEFDDSSMRARPRSAGVVSGVIERRGDVEDQSGVRYHLVHGDGSADVFDGAGRLVALQDAFGNRTEVILHQTAGDIDTLFETIRDCADLRGLVRTYRRLPVGSAREWRLVQVAESPSNRPVGVSTPLRVYSLSYDASGHLASIRDPAGAQWTLGADDRHRLVRSCDWGGGCTEYSYEAATGALHRVSEQRFPSGLRMSVLRQSEPASEPAWTLEARYSTADGDTHFQRYLQDSMGRITRVYAMDSAASFRTVVHDSSGRVNETRDAFGRLTRLRYGPQGYLTEIVRDPADRAETVRFSGHDAMGRPTAITDEEGRRVEVAYFGVGPIREIRRFDGVRVIRTTFEYDQLGRRSRVTEPTGLVHRYEYSARRALPSRIAHEDPDRGTVIEERFEYDWRDQVTAHTDVRGVTRRFERDSLGRTVGMTLDPAGTPTTFQVTYDALGHPIRLVADAAGSRRTWTARYASVGEGYAVVESRDPAGDVTQFDHDELGRHVATRWLGANDDGSDRVERMTYVRVDGPVGGVRLSRWLGEGSPVEVTFLDDAGLVRWREDGRASRTTYEHDAVGRTIRVTSGAAATSDGATAWPVATHLEYDRSGLLLRQRRGAGSDAERFDYEYNGLRQLVRIIDGEGRATAVHDALGDGRRVQVVHGEGHPTESWSESFEYDAFGRLLESSRNTREGVQVARVSYGVGEGTDVNAWDPRQITGADGRRLTVRYDTRGLAIAVSDGGGVESYTTRYAYDRLLQLSSVTMPRGLVRSFAYDPAGRVVEISELVGSTRRTQYLRYRSHGAIAEAADVDGTRTALAYDGRGRLRGARAGFTGALGAVPSSLDVTLDYFGNDLVSRTSDPAGVTVREYDAANRLTASSRDGTRVWYRYGANRGELVEMGMNDAVEQQYEVDRSGRVSRIGVPTIGFAADVRYRADGRIDEISRVARPGTTRLTTVARGHDGGGAAHQLRTVAVTGTTSVDLVDHRFARSVGGRISSDRVVGGTETTFERDVRGQLTSARTVSGDGLPAVLDYSYDEQGNRTRDELGTAMVDPTGRITSARVEYDARGNVVRVDTTRFAYDAWNRLVRSEAPGLVVEYAYDGEGRLVRRVANGRATRFTYDENGPLPSLLATHEDSVARTIFVHGPWGPLAERTAGGSARHYVTSQRSVERVVGTDGAVVGASRYAPYGAASAALPGVPATGTALGFQGELANPDGTIYLRSRVYHPGLGRFLQRDTHAGDASDPLSQNRYMFAHGDPTTFRDPSGHSVTSDASAVGAGFLSQFIPSMVEDIRSLPGGGQGLGAIGELAQQVASSIGIDPRALTDFLRRVAAPGETDVEREYCDWINDQWLKMTGEMGLTGTAAFQRGSELGFMARMIGGAREVLRSLPNIIRGAGRRGIDPSLGGIAGRGGRDGRLASDTIRDLDLYDVHVGSNQRLNEIWHDVLRQQYASGSRAYNDYLDAIDAGSVSSDLIGRAFGSTSAAFRRRAVAEGLVTPAAGARLNVHHWMAKSRNPQYAFDSGNLFVLDDAIVGGRRVGTHIDVHRRTQTGTFRGPMYPGAEIDLGAPRCDIVHGCGP